MGLGSALKAGTAYFAVAIVAGVALGTIRVLVLESAFGVSVATAIELPFMLAASWYACRWLVGSFDVPVMLRHRLAMGGIAFALLIFAETVIGTVGQGRDLAAQLRRYGEFGPALGLAGQLVFAAFPVLQASRRSREAPHP